MPLGTEIDLGPGHNVFDGAQLPGKGHSSPAPSLRSMSIVAKRSPISATAELLFTNFAGLTVNCLPMFVHMSDATGS